MYHHSTYLSLGLSTYLEVDNNEHHKDGCQQLTNIGRVLAVESLLQRAQFVLLGQEEVEKGNDCAFELGALLSADSHGRETLP